MFSESARSSCAVCDGIVNSNVGLCVRISGTSSLSETDEGCWISVVQSSDPSIGKRSSPSLTDCTLIVILLLGLVNRLLATYNYNIVFCSHPHRCLPVTAASTNHLTQSIRMKTTTIRKSAWMLSSDTAISHE